MTTSKPDPAQQTAPESMPPAVTYGAEGSGSEAVTGASPGSAAGVTGDDADAGKVGGTDAYPADGATPDRGSSTR